MAQRFNGFGTIISINNNKRSLQDSVRRIAAEKDRKAFEKLASDLDADLSDPEQVRVVMDLMPKKAQPLTLTHNTEFRQFMAEQGVRKL